METSDFKSVAPIPLTEWRESRRSPKFGELTASINPQELQRLLDELEASRASRKRAWENLQEIRWVLKDVAGVELPPPARKTIDLEGRIVKDGVRKTVNDRQLALDELVKAIREFRKFTDQPVT